MTRARKKLAQRIAASLAAGAALTVAVAWGHAIIRGAPDDWVKHWMDGVSFATQWGAPFEAMTATHHVFIDNSNAITQFVDRLRPGSNSPFRAPTPLPLRPLWPGFALNTAFYAAIIFLLCSAPGVVRRRHRLRRGHCPACGYDLKGQRDTPTKPCPECGT